MNVSRWWYQWRCRRNHHVDELINVGHHPYKACRFCNRPGILTKDEVLELRSRWLPCFDNGGGDEVVAVETGDDASSATSVSS